VFKLRLIVGGEEKSGFQLHLDRDIRLLHPTEANCFTLVPLWLGRSHRPKRLISVPAVQNFKTFIGLTFSSPLAQVIQQPPSHEKPRGLTAKVDMKSPVVRWYRMMPTKLPSRSAIVERSQGVSGPLV